MRTAPCRLFWLLFCTVGLLFGGCGPKQLPTMPVHGTVTWQGKPLAEGTVAFMPLRLAEGLPNRPAIGELKRDGTYRVSSFRAGDGLLPGEYAVTVYSYTSQPTLDQPNRPLVWRIPERYGDNSKSGLKFTVPADASNPLTFDIDIQQK